MATVPSRVVTDVPIMAHIYLGSILLPVRLYICRSDWIHYRLDRVVYTNDLE